MNNQNSSGFATHDHLSQFHLFLVEACSILPLEIWIGKIHKSDKFCGAGLYRLRICFKVGWFQIKLYYGFI